MFGWLSPSQDRPDVKINVICPATDVHIRKVRPSHPKIYSSSDRFLVFQTTYPYRARNTRAL